MAKKTALENLEVKPNPEKTVNGRAVQVDHPFQPGRKINKNGEKIQNCSFVQRRLKDGDLVLVGGKKAKPTSSGPSHQEKPKDIEK